VRNAPDSTVLKGLQSSHHKIPEGDSLVRAASHEPFAVRPHRHGPHGGPLPAAAGVPGPGPAIEHALSGRSVVDLQKEAKQI
jgi:hypothetical protein